MAQDSGNGIKMPRHSGNDSGNAGTLLGVGALLILLFAIIGALYLILFRGKKEKGSALLVGPQQEEQVLGGKSKISSQKSAKNSSKTSLGGKSTPSQKSSKG